MEQDTNQPSEKEPTVLDLYKSVTKDWRSFFNFIRSIWDARRREELNQALAYEAAQPVAVEQAEEPMRSDMFPFRAVLAFLLALLAQALVEPPLRLGIISVAIYLAAFGVAVWSYLSNEWRLPALPVAWRGQDPLTMRLVPLGFALFTGLIAFVLFGDGMFTWLNVAFWLVSLMLLVYSFWVPAPKIKEERIKNRWVWFVLVSAAFGLVVFFRLTQLVEVPIEPFSDHAEKILDVYDITQGETYIFFERNTGREAIQMYWTLLVDFIFGTGLSFMSLKLGTALLGIFTVPFVYMLGKEVGNERVALFALFLFGVASWPNIISRIGLRFPLYPLFVAPTLLFLIRGLRTQSRNDLILAGIFLGLGLHGYSPFRIVPILVVIAFGIYIMHAKSTESRQQAIFWLLLIVIVSVFVFSPLLRYWIGHPDKFGYRAFTRLSSVEMALPGPAWQIFLSNMYKGLLMFNWDDGDIQTHSVLNRPALDLISAALFLLGVLLLIVRYIRQKDWRDLFLLVSVPVLIQPSVLSLAFPGENPALNRAGGASVVVFIIAALALDGLVVSFGSELKRKVIAYSMVVVLFAGIGYSNYDLVFNQFGEAFKASSWNTSEMGEVIIYFEKEYGQTDTVWIVPFPFWVDTRLPGVWAGIPNRNFAMWSYQLSDSLAYPAPKMFIYWNADTETENILKELYPNGEVTRYTSEFPGKDFYIFLVEQ
ncbi:MAG: glycosyltransferase family 39 protein [Anaerolineales bacterium]|nr:glycosyltransferase family 39 protein [Anaerolineales bacterium]MCB9146521.1 glycosyltransferase family 39 protein [Anaerolineales bacterium]